MRASPVCAANGFLWGVLLLLSLGIAKEGIAQSGPLGDVAGEEELTRTRMRVIVDNDFGGDPDGLFQLAHHLLSPSVTIRGVIASHQYPNGFYGYPGSPEHAAALADDLLGTMGLADDIGVYRGASARIGEGGAPASSAAAQFIVQEAMRTDTDLPLVIACGAGLTDVASAYLMEPRIAERIRIVWIGGHEHEGMASPPPGGTTMEYNTGIDPKAAQVVFNESDIPIWQVPRDAYRQALVSYAELDHRIDGGGALGGFLLGRLRDLIERADGRLGEAYVLGDNPLVLLTALQSGWEADPSSSRYASLPTPTITDEGLYAPGSAQRRPMRVYTHLDNRLMFEDLYAKVARFDRRVEAPR